MHIWLDSETTGLEPEEGTTLEIHAKAADERTRRVISSFQMVRHFDEWDKVHPTVLAMHTKSGLMEECKTSPHTLADMQVALLKWVEKIDSKYRTLAGSSVHFDRKFIKAEFPAFYRVLFYRQYDVSSLYPLFFNIDGFPCHPIADKDAIPHRAQQDIEASMAIDLHYHKTVSALVALWELCQKGMNIPGLGGGHGLTGPSHDEIQFFGQMGSILDRLPKTVCPTCHKRMATAQDRKNHEWGPPTCKGHWCSGKCWGHAAVNA